MELYELIEAIDAALVELLVGAKDDIGCEEVILGEEAAVDQLARSAIWIIPEEAHNSHENAAIAEEWVYPVNVTAMATFDRPAEGRLKVTQMAAKASSVLIKARERGSDSTLSTLISDVVRSTYMPAGDDGLKEEGLMYSGYRLLIRFRHREE